MLVVVMRKKSLSILAGVLLIFSLIAGIYFSKTEKNFFLQGYSVRDTAAYGEPLPWEVAKELYPRFAVADIIDVESGKRLQVQRRGGTYHADVQPLTAKDTQVLKEIYHGKWSWKRRAVIVEIGLNRIAASVNGMPHGAGNIQDNNFDGHFCLHFLYSRVHASNKIDPAHQLMVWKAAGRPEEPFLKAGPSEVINLVLTALNQNDTGLAALGLYSAKSEDLWLACQALFGRIPEFSVRSIVEEKQENDKANDRGDNDNDADKEDGSGGQMQDITVQRQFILELSLLYPGETVKQERKARLTVIQDPIGERWFVEGSGLKKIIEEG